MGTHARRLALQIGCFRSGDLHRSEIWNKARGRPTSLGTAPARHAFQLALSLAGPRFCRRWAAVGGGELLTAGLPFVIHEGRTLDELPDKRLEAQDLAPQLDGTFKEGDWVIVCGGMTAQREQRRRSR